MEKEKNYSVVKISIIFDDFLSGMNVSKLGKKNNNIYFEKKTKLSLKNVTKICKISN